MKVDPSADGALRRDRPSVTFHDLSANRKAHADPFIFGSAMEPLERREHAFPVLFLEAHAVVLNG